MLKIGDWVELLHPSYKGIIGRIIDLPTVKGSPIAKIETVSSLRIDTVTMNLGYCKKYHSKITYHKEDE